MSDQRDAYHPEAFRFVVAIDGPGASGKSTIAKRVADELGGTFLDTGALYRAVCLAALNAGVAPSDEESLAQLAQDLDVRFEQDGTVLVDGQDVRHLLRSRQVTNTVSQVSAHPKVRQALMPIQRRIAATGKPVVIVGRDIATVVAPSAGVKIYIDASDEVRAKRRLREELATGVETDYETELKQLRHRDMADSTRAVAPLTASPEAVIINTDTMSIDEVVKKVLQIANAAWTGTGALDVDC